MKNPPPPLRLHGDINAPGVIKFFTKSKKVSKENNQNNFQKNHKLRDKCLRISLHQRNFAGQMFADSWQIRKH